MHEHTEAVDVVVVGFGAAGASAAIEAADRGARVVVLDRWGGGGATARSGGIVYLGGGTPNQVAAGFDDDPGTMYEYLHEEEGDAVDPAVLRRFCERSVADRAWLEEQGVRFPPGFERHKAIVPTDDEVGLYYSGNERHYAGGDLPVPRGHRVGGRGMTGWELSHALTTAARSRGIEVRTGARPVRLVVSDGVVTGVEVIQSGERPAVRAAHRALFQAATLSGMAARRVPGSLTRAIEQLEERSGRRYTLVARRGVVLATGGFSYNAAMMRTYAPSYAGAMPLGTAGDDGAGIRLGLSVGAATKLMDHCGASRFITPPVAFASGILVDERGERVCDESMYAASLSKAIAKRGGRAWLIVDGAIRDRVRAEMRAQARVRDRPLGEIVRGKANHVAFPLVFGTINLHLNRELSSSLRGLAVRCGIPPDELVRTVQHYNDRVEAGEPDELGKPPELVSVLVQPPFAAIPCHLDSVVFPAPCITLGGLLVDGHTQQVLRADGSAIGGLYAAGRTAAGVASRSYVSGLSLADCVFSGRNAGMALGAAPATVTLDAGPPRRAGVDPPDGR